MLIRDWSSDVCSSVLLRLKRRRLVVGAPNVLHRRLRHRADQGIVPGIVHLDHPVAADEITGDTHAFLARLGVHGECRSLGLLRQADSAAAGWGGPAAKVRSEERRVGKECVSTFSSRWPL